MATMKDERSSNTSLQTNTRTRGKNITRYVMYDNNKYLIIEFLDVKYKHDSLKSLQDTVFKSPIQNDRHIFQNVI